MRLAIFWTSRRFATAAVLLLSVVTAATAAASSGGTGQCGVVLKAAGAGISSGAQPAQARRGARTNATFALSRTEDGGLKMTVRSGDLEAEKTVYSDGHFRLTVHGGEDSLSVELAGDAVSVERHGRHARIDPRQASEDDWRQVAETLAGSKALRLFRTLAADTETVTLESPGGQAIVVSDAALGLLSGDVAAVSRVARQMRVAHQRHLRPASVALTPQAEFLNCYVKYSDAVVQAADEYNGCRADTWTWDFFGYLCSFEWTLKVESSWFQFLSCSAIPYR